MQDMIDALTPLVRVGIVESSEARRVMEAVPRPLFEPDAQPFDIILSDAHGYTVVTRARALA